MDPVRESIEQRSSESCVTEYEAARLVNDAESSISDMIGLIRGTGIGLDLSVQSAQVAPSIRSNTLLSVRTHSGRGVGYADLVVSLGHSLLVVEAEMSSKRMALFPQKERDLHRCKSLTSLWLRGPDLNR